MFGFGKGKIKLQMDTYDFSYGKPIKGKFILKLKKPIKANGLNVRIIGYSMSRNMRGSQSTQKMVDEKHMLDGAKEYPAKELSYSFNFKAPVNSAKSLQEGKMGKALKVMSAMGGMRSYMKWYLSVELDIPKGIDVTKKVKINIV
jgi:hypothetical protein